MGNYAEDFVLSFAKRTRANLKYIENHLNDIPTNHDDEKLYEVTQLINSLLGMLVFIHENRRVNLHKKLQYYQQDAQIVWKEDHPRAWKDLRPNAMKQVIRHMRNSLAHGGIKPYSDDNTNISGFIFTDTKKIENREADNGYVEYWELKLTVDAIKKIAEDLVTVRPY